MDGTIESVIELMRAHAAWILFAWLALENTLFLGVVVPGLTVLLVAGLLVYTGDVRLDVVLLAGIAGTWLGDTVNYLIGRWGLRRLAWVRRVIEQNDAVHRFLDRYPKIVYVFFHFPVYLRTAFPLTLGSMRTPWRTWLWIDAVAAPLFVGVFVGLGYLLARFVLQTTDLAAAAREIAQTGNGIIVLFSLIFVYGTVKFVRLLWRSARVSDAVDEETTA